MRTAFLAMLLVLVTPNLLAKNGVLTITRQNIQTLICDSEIHKPIPREQLSEFKLGDQLFMPIAWYAAEPTQASRSYDSIIKHLKGRHTFSKKEIERALKYNNGKSLFDMKHAAQAALTDGGLVLLEGYNHFLASLLIGAQTLPTKIIKDYRGKSREEVNRLLVEQNLTYYLSHQGDFYKPQFFCDMLEDEYRYLASLLIARAVVSKDQITLKKSAEFPLAIKFTGDVPETGKYELKLGAALRAAGVRYDAAVMGSELRPSFVEAARAKLMRYYRFHPELKPLVLISEKASIEGVSLHSYLQVYLKAKKDERMQFCTALFTRPVISLLDSSLESL